VIEYLISGPLVTAITFAMIALEAGRAAAAASILVYILALPLVVGGGAGGAPFPPCF
jgi:hypothetical protein